MNNSGNKKIRVCGLLLLLVTGLIFESCSTSKKQYIFSKYSVTNRASSSPDSSSVENPVIESEEINSIDAGSDEKENKSTQILLDTSSVKSKTKWENDSIHAPTKVEQSDTVRTHVKKRAEQKTPKDQKTEKAKGSKIGILIIALLAIIILGAVIVNNSIPDFGSGNIFHF